MGNCSDRVAVTLRPARVMAPEAAKNTTLEGWKTILTGDEFRVLRCGATEKPNTGIYNDAYPKTGHFGCRGCGAALYSADSKFKCGCGWPAFDKAYRGSVATRADNTRWMTRVEILCAQCRGHLGHVFNGEKLTPTNQRHCVNSIAIRYFERDVDRSEAKV